MVRRIFVLCALRSSPLTHSPFLLPKFPTKKDACRVFFPLSHHFTARTRAIISAMVTGFAVLTE